MLMYISYHVFYILQIFAESQEMNITNKIRETLRSVSAGLCRYIIDGLENRGQL